MLKLIRVLYSHNSKCHDKNNFYISFPDMTYFFYFILNLEIFIDLSFIFSLQLMKFLDIR